MVAGEGGRQEVSGDELGLLAQKAEQASIDVARLRNRVQDIVNGADRRGWTACAFHDQWARARLVFPLLCLRHGCSDVRLHAEAVHPERLNTRLCVAADVVLSL